MDWIIVALSAFVCLITVLAIRECERLQVSLKKLKDSKVDIHQVNDICDEYQVQIDRLEDERDTARVSMHAGRCHYEAQIEELQEQLSMQRLEILCWEEDYDMIRGALWKCNNRFNYLHSRTAMYIGNIQDHLKQMDGPC